MTQKISKDQIQKLALSVVGFVALLYVYFNFFIGPLNKSRAAMTARINLLQDKVGASKNEMMKTSNLEQQASAANARFTALQELSPEGAPIAWFPPRIKAFFANQSIEKASARLDTTSEFKQKELAAWMKYVWLIDVPQADFDALGKAIAELENTEPLLSIVKLSIRASAEEQQFQQVTMSAATIIDKK